MAGHPCSWKKSVAFEPLNYIAEDLAKKA